MPESVEGLAETWVTYRLKAEIGRKYAKDIVVRKPLRIIRTLPSAALEISHEMVSHPRVWSSGSDPSGCGKRLAKQGRVFD